MSRSQFEPVAASAEYPTVVIGGLPIAAITRREAARTILAMADKDRCHSSRPYYLTSANGEVIARSATDPNIAKLFLNADQIVADGQPMVLASRFVCAHALPERVATTDLFHDVAALAEKSGHSFYFLGATAEENLLAVENTQSAYPNLRIAGHSHGFLSGDELTAKLSEIKQLRPDILWLAMGVPREQEFIDKHAAALTGVGVIKTSGGLFNFLSGKNRRAPLWMQNIGLEWAYRLSLEPKRLLMRYLTTNFSSAILILTRSR
jgi:exopolysaccharide biosynthesis WecB/TagA/CpsF family protein